jgi:hypothetical protein
MSNTPHGDFIFYLSFCEKEKIYTYNCIHRLNQFADFRPHSYNADILIT